MFGQLTAVEVYKQASDLYSAKVYAENRGTWVMGAAGQYTYSLTESCGFSENPQLSVRSVFNPAECQKIPCFNISTENSQTTLSYPAYLILKWPLIGEINILIFVAVIFFDKMWT